MENAQETPLDIEWALVGILAATKAADAGTTLVGLGAFPGVQESNPFVLEAIGRLGVPLALLVLSLAVVVVITLVVEGTAAALVVTGSSPPWGPVAVKLTGYGLASVVHVLIAVHNVSILVFA